MTEEVAILFFTVNFAFRCRVIEFQFLHGIPHRVDLLLKQGLQVVTLVVLSLAFFDTCFDSTLMVNVNRFLGLVIHTRQRFTLLEKHSNI